MSCNAHLQLQVAFALCSVLSQAWYCCAYHLHDSIKDNRWYIGVRLVYAAHVIGLLNLYLHSKYALWRLIMRQSLLTRIILACSEVVPCTDEEMVCTSPSTRIVFPCHLQGMVL